MKRSSPVIPAYQSRETPSPQGSVSGLCAVEISEKLYSMQEVSHHCDHNSCWVVVDNVVYDITKFLSEHPGGPDILLEHAGRDCTVPFQDKGHTTFAVTLLSKYKIGMLREEERITL